MADKVQFRRDTFERWKDFNPVLSEGELGLETDTGLMKVGDGVRSWNNLLYTDINHKIKPVNGGSSSSSPTILRPGPLNRTAEMGGVQGWFINGTAAEPPVATGTPWLAPETNDNSNWWTGTTWGLGSSVPLPSAPIANDYGTSTTDAMSQNKVTEVKERVDIIEDDPVLGLVSIISNDEFLYALVDLDYNLLWGKRYDGTTYDCDSEMADNLQSVISELNSLGSDFEVTKNTVIDNKKISDNRYSKLYFNKGYFLNNLSNAFSEDIFKRYANSLAIKKDLQNPTFQTTLNAVKYPNEYRHHDAQWDLDASGNVYLVFTAIGSHSADDSTQALNHVRLAIFNISNMSSVTYIDLAENGNVVDGRPIREGTGQANVKVIGDNVHIWMTCTLDSPTANKQTIIKTTYSISNGTLGPYSVCKFKKDASWYELNFANLSNYYPECVTGNANTTGQISISTTLNLHSDGMYYGTVTRHYTIYPIVIKTSDFINYEIVKVSNDLPIDPLFESATIINDNNLYMAVRQMYRSDTVSGITLPTNNNYYLDGVLAKLDLVSNTWVDFVKIPQQGSRMSFIKDQYNTLYLLSNAYSTNRNNAYIAKIDYTALNRSVLAIDAKLTSSWDSPIAKIYNGNMYCSYTFSGRIAFTQFNFGYGIDVDSIFKTLFGI